MVRNPVRSDVHIYIDTYTHMSTPPAASWVSTTAISAATDGHYGGRDDAYLIVPEHLHIPVRRLPTQVSFVTMRLRIVFVYRTHRRMRHVSFSMRSIDPAIRRRASRFRIGKPNRWRGSRPKIVPATRVHWTARENIFHKTIFPTLWRLSLFLLLYSSLLPHVNN